MTFLILRSIIKALNDFFYDSPSEKTTHIEMDLKVKGEREKCSSYANLKWQGKN